jgi:predicted metal-dependent phosphoesterase TrpH
MIASGKLDYIAITDHDRIDFALEARKKLGDVIIVGEEIKTIEGELVGLFLRNVIPAGLTAQETAERIHAQGGLVYVPHPFETVRSGVTDAALYKIADLVDIMEIFNGRAMFQNCSQLAMAWTLQHNCSAAASSDAHGKSGWGRTYSEISLVPTTKTLAQSLANARYNKELVGIRGILYPKFNRLRKRLLHA